MTTDALQNDQQGSLSGQERITEVSSNGVVSSNSKSKTMLLNNEQFLEFQEKVFSIISENNGKLIFADLLEHMGVASSKGLLYKALMNLAKQQRIVRIRGIGKSRIEFYYYDTKKIKKQHPSAAVSYANI
jgi:hypothetical protein